MEVVFEVTKAFDKDMKRQPRSSRMAIVAQINTQTQLFLAKPDEFRAEALRPHKIALREPFEATLYVIRASRDLRVILTVDEDSIFQRTVVTLFRVAKHDDMSTAYRELADRLYQGWITEISEGEAYAY